MGKCPSGKPRNRPARHVVAAANLSKCFLVPVAPLDHLALLVVGAVQVIVLSDHCRCLFQRTDQNILPYILWQFLSNSRTGLVLVGRRY
jgi:hypothetical protein